MASSRPNYLSVILSVALVLLLIGIFVLTAAYGNRLVALYKEKVDIWLELKPDIADSEVARVVGNVRAQPFVKKETLTFITKEQAAATMRKDLGDESLLEDLPNLMRNVVRFNVKSAFLTSDSLASWRAEIRRDTAVADVFFEAILIPMFFLVGFLGSRARKIRAAYLLFFYTLFGSLLIRSGSLGGSLGGSLWLYSLFLYFF